MGRIQGFVPEDAVDGEVLLRLELSSRVGQLVKHPGRHRRGVGAEQVLLGLGDFPIVAVALRPKAT